MAAAAAVYGGLKAKLGVEDAPELQLNRIRITLSSKNVKNLEKGMTESQEPQTPFSRSGLSPLATLVVYSKTYWCEYKLPLLADLYVVYDYALDLSVELVACNIVMSRWSVEDM